MLSGRPDLLPKTVPQRDDVAAVDGIASAPENAEPATLEKSGFVPTSQALPPSLDASWCVADDLNNTSGKKQGKGASKR